MESDVFNKFKDGNGEFKVSDMKGVMSLYEATQFRTNGELVLDDAFAFTTSELKSMASRLSSPHYVEYIVNALNGSYHKGIPRLEARQYVCFYQQEDEARNDTLLKLAKYDFNRIQMMLRQELSNLCSWGREENIENFLAVGFYFEPRFARARNIYAKLLSIIGLIDDTYDAYGAYEKLQCFTDAMQRFDISAMDQLPTDQLKLVYQSVLKVHDEAEEKVRKEGRSYGVSYTKAETKEVAAAYLTEARWVHERYLPTVDEYLETALKTSGAVVSVAQDLVGMEEADETAFQWLINTDNKIH